MVLIQYSTPSPINRFTPKQMKSKQRVLNIHCKLFSASLLFHSNSIMLLKVLVFLNIIPVSIKSKKDSWIDSGQGVVYFSWLSLRTIINLLFFYSLGLYAFVSSFNIEYVYPFSKDAMAAVRFVFFKNLIYFVLDI